MNRVKDILKEGGAVIGVAAFPSDDLGFLARSGFDFSRYPGKGGQEKVSRPVFLGVLFSNGVAVTLYYTGTFQDPDGSVAMQNFYAGYLLELTLSLDNLFAFYLIFKFFKVRDTEAVERTLFWGILGAMVLRAVVVAIGVVAIEQSECVLFLAAIVLLWTAVTVFAGEEDEDEDLENNAIIKFCKRWMPVTHEYDGSNFFTETPEGQKMTPLMLVNVVINLSDIAFAMDSVPAVFILGHVALHRHTAPLHSYFTSFPLHSHFTSLPLPAP